VLQLTRHLQDYNIGPSVTRYVFESTLSLIKSRWHDLH